MSVTRRYLRELYMPAVDTSAVPRSIRKDVQAGVDRVRNGDPVGVEEERYVGSVPVHIDRDPPYAGVTEFSPGYAGPEARRMGVSDRLHPRSAKRVAAHEARHIRSEKMLKYADVPEGAVTLVMESYAEYGEIKSLEKAGRYAEAEEIRRTTPYPGAVRFGEGVDRSYVSQRDGKEGFETFIRDIFRYKSMQAAFENLFGNVREARAYKEAA